MAFPCNQFLGQEPGTPEEIKEFIAKYESKFMIMEKINVNGPNASEVYRYLKSVTDQQPIDWNFAKYLCDRKGKCVHYTSTHYPSDLEEEIVRLLVQ